MKKRLMTATAVLIVPLFLGLILWQMNASATPATAQTTPDTDAERVIQVTGNGAVSAQPDIATVRLGVQTEADTAVDALDQNNVRMSDLISATLEAGVAEEDIQTQGLRLQPVYDRSDDTPELTGYRASNIVEVTIRDLDNLGATLDAAIAAGGNTIENIRFEVSDREELLAAAREAAMNDAIQKAEQLTALADAELGEVLTITELGGTGPVPVALERVESESAAVPVSPGTQTIEANVQVSWRIQ